MLPVAGAGQAEQAVVHQTQSNNICPGLPHISARCTHPPSQEFCNKGTLSDGIECGWFRKHGSQYDLDYSALLRTAKEVRLHTAKEVMLRPPL